MDALDDRWRRLKELVAWLAYHSGIGRGRRAPSYKKVLRSVVPFKKPSPEQLAAKLDTAFRALAARFDAAESRGG